MPAQMTALNEVLLRQALGCPDDRDLLTHATLIIEEARDNLDALRYLEEIAEVRDGFWHIPPVLSVDVRQHGSTFVGSVLASASAQDAIDDALFTSMEQQLEARPRDPVVPERSTDDECHRCHRSGWVTVTGYRGAVEDVDWLYRCGACSLDWYGRNPEEG